MNAPQSGRERDKDSRPIPTSVREYSATQIFSPLGPVWQHPDKMRQPVKPKQVQNGNPVQEKNEFADEICCENLFLPLANNNPALVASWRGASMALRNELGNERKCSALAESKVEDAMATLKMDELQVLNLSLTLMPGQKAGIRGQGSRIVEVYTDTPAARAGLKAGDVLQRWDGSVIHEQHTIIQAMAETQQKAYARQSVQKPKLVVCRQTRK
eukprot:CAMPEP_0119310654 /NCGR_PEP_ID=MMETSP1333-20130426/19694_1 /TAXON_ID=418940 /ORGANISM="Scyphosphaera apsteinii, Strain RCC1455" /LENGTH=213 /DNA_ID=CAMNT_0007314873 /DNA_START=13 /DNA_END=654 /DNA_ORIENTATION=-